MSGLGIVIEEPESTSPRADAPADSAMSTPRLSIDSYAAAETLLPPLPEADEDRHNSPALRLSMPAFTNPSVPSVLSPGASLGRSSSAPSSVEILQAERFFAPPESADLDLTALNTEPTTLPFPSLDTFESQTSISPPVGNTNVSPMKRLKSLKNGIRKLSLSRITSSTSLASSDASPKVTTPPIHPDLANDDSSLSESGRSTFTHTHTNSAANSNHTHTNSAHTHTSSQGSIIIPKSRCRTVSQSFISGTSPTPPLPQPVVVLSENLSSTRQNLAAVEQTFMENMPPALGDSQYNSSFSSSSSSSLSHPVLSASNVSAAASEGPVNPISMLQTPDELMEYSLYLSEHKKSVETAYDVSRERLESSGWCSGHDIENLALQKDSSLSQIDTKILQIEEKLSQEFKMSLLNNTAGKCGLKNALSPSLKDLESRCLSYSSEKI